MADSSNTAAAVVAHKAVLDSLSNDKKIDYISKTDLPLAQKNDLRAYVGKNI